MFCVIHTHTLCVGFGFHRFRFRFPHRSTQGTDGCCSAHKAAAKNNVHDLAKVHTTLFFSQSTFYFCFLAFLSE